MRTPIEDYALIGDGQTAALVSRNGSIDWMCLPRFDGGACFAALLGSEANGRWLLAPCSERATATRRYRPGTLVLETTHATPEGEVTVVDFMPAHEPEGEPSVVRVIEGRRGRVPMRMELVIRFDYGSIIPWVTRSAGGHLQAVAGPDTLTFTTSLPLRGERMTTVSTFDVSEGDRFAMTLSWRQSHKPARSPRDPWEALRHTEQWWQRWSARCTYQGDHADAVLRSLITLKALIYAPTGAIVAAPTTSLPEKPGGVRNWDYRLCWLRDATFTLYSLMTAGYHAEARAWQQWLLRAVAGEPSKVQIMYGLAGERRLIEREIDWLPGHDGRPVRVGNDAYRQFQLDVYGEVMDVLHQGRRVGLAPDGRAWRLQQALVDFVASAWQEDDEGIWEVRGSRRPFTHSKVMAWVALDRVIQSAEQFHLPGPIDRWRALRDQIHEDVCRRGFDARKGAFVQYYGSNELDASLLMIPLVGFLPAHDPRVRGTVEAIQRELVSDGLVLRYRPESTIDGLPPGEGVFLACSFWLADCLALMGRTEEARRLFDRLLGLRNDVGLLSEEYDMGGRRMLGNFPQAFSHVSLVNTAVNLSSETGPAEHRGQTDKSPPNTRERPHVL